MTTIKEMLRMRLAIIGSLIVFGCFSVCTVEGYFPDDIFHLRSVLSMFISGGFYYK